MDLKGVYGVRIKGNTFTNTNSNLDREDMGIGIRSSNSTFKVVDRYHPFEQKNENTFEKLFYGIKSSGWHYKGATKINGNSFNDVYRSVLLINSHSAEVMNNTINVSDKDASIPMASNKIDSYGIYLDGGSGFKVEENNISSFNSPTDVHGVVINNTGAINNEIYNNNLTDLSEGIQPQFNNRGKSNNAEIG
ncbi:MAG: hypothetical protein ACQESZ_09130, partial [Bacteroidota bacterium]